MGHACGSKSSGSIYGPVAGSCEHGSGHSVSIKGAKFLDQLSDYELLKEDSAPWSYLVVWLVG
jgi:hypothetical protein